MRGAIYVFRIPAKVRIANDYVLKPKPTILKNSKLWDAVSQKEEPVGGYVLKPKPTILKNSKLWDAVSQLEEHAGD